MGFEELVRTRYSARAYEPTPVDDDSLARILEAVRLAPTAANRQAFRVFVLATEGREHELRRVYDRGWFVQARSSSPCAPSRPRAGSAPPTAGRPPAWTRR